MLEGSSIASQLQPSVRQEQITDIVKAVADFMGQPGDGGEAIQNNETRAAQGNVTQFWKNRSNISLFPHTTKPTSGGEYLVFD